MVLNPLPGAPAKPHKVIKKTPLPSRADGEGAADHKVISAAPASLIGRSVMPLTATSCVSAEGARGLLVKVWRQIGVCSQAFLPGGSSSLFLPLLFLAASGGTFLFIGDIIRMLLPKDFIYCHFRIPHICTASDNLMNNSTSCCAGGGVHETVTQNPPSQLRP